MEVDLENEILDLVSGPEEGEISEEDESKDNTQPKYDVTDYSRKDKLSTTVIYDDRGRTTIVGGSAKNSSWPVSSYSANDRPKWREKDDEIIVVKKVVAKKSSEKHTKKIRHHSKKRGKHRKHKSRTQEVSKSSSKSRHNAKKSRRSRSVSVSSCSSRSSSTSDNNSDGDSSSCSCSSRSPTPTRNRSKSRSPDNKKMRGKENKHGSVSEKKLLNRLRPYSPPKPEPEVKRSTKSSPSFSSIKRSFPKKGSSRGTHRISPLSRNEIQSNSSGSSSRSKNIGSSRNGKPNSSFSIIKKTRPSSISNPKTSSSISNSKTSINNKRNTSNDTSKSRTDHSSKPRRKTTESTTTPNVIVSLPGGTAPTPGSIGEMLLKKQRKGVLKAPVPEKDDLKYSLENSLVNSIGCSSLNENGAENSDLHNRITDNGSNQGAMGQDEDDLLQLRLVALKSSLKVLSQVRQEGRDAKKSSLLISEMDQVHHHSDIREIPCEKTSEKSSVIDEEKKVPSNCQSPQCEIIEEVYSVDASPLSVLFETALGFSPVNSPDSKWPVVTVENSIQNSQVNLECSNDAGDIDTVAISTKKSYLDDLNGGKGEDENQIEEILLEPEDENQDPVDMDICDSSPEDIDILDEVVILEEVGEDISISSSNSVGLNGAIRVRNDLLDGEENEISKFQIPVEWAYMMPPPPPPDQPENDIGNFNDWCYDQNMYLQSMQESSYDSQQAPYDSSNQSHYQNYQKGSQIDPSMTTNWQQNQSSSHWNNHYDNSYENITDDLLNIPETQNDHPDDLVTVQSSNLDHHEVTDGDGMSKELKDSAAQYYQAFMSAMVTRQNSDSTTDTQNTDTTKDAEISLHCPQSQMEQQIDALLAMSRSKKNALITVVQSQSTRGERKRRRRARMREIRQAKKTEKKAVKHQEPANKVLNTSIEISSAQSTSSPVVSSPNITDDDNEDLDLLRAQLLIDLHKKRSKQEVLQNTSETPVSEGSSMSSESSIVKRTVVRKLRGTQKSETHVQSKALSKKRNISSKMHDIGGFSLDPKSTRFDFPVPKDMPKFKFPPVKPVIISLNPDDDTSDEEDENQVELPCTSSKSSQSFSPSPSTSKEASISTDNQSSNVSGKNIDDLLKSFRNASIPPVSQKKKGVTHNKAKAVVKDSSLPSTPNIVRHLSRTQQVEYLQLKEQIRKKEMLQQKRQQLLKRKQKSEATNKFQSLEEKVKIRKINTNNKIRGIEEKIKSAKSSLRNTVPDSNLANHTQNIPNRIIPSEVKESQENHEHADLQPSAVEHDISASHNYSLETKITGKNVTVQPCNSSQENEKLQKNKHPLEMRIDRNMTEESFNENIDVTKGINEDEMNFNEPVDNNIYSTIELEKDLMPTISNKDTISPCSPKLDNEIAQDMNEMDEDEEVLRLMVLQTINRRSGNSTTMSLERPVSDSINTEQGSQAVSKDEKERVPNSNSSESALKERNTAEEMSKLSLEPHEVERCDDDEDVSSDQESDLVLPEEWFTVDDVEVLELVKAGSPSSQKTSNENINISKKNSKVSIPLGDNKCVSTDESSQKTNVEGVMDYTEITSHADIESKCKENKSSLQSDLNDISMSIPKTICKVSCHSEYDNSSFNDEESAVQTNTEINRNTDVASNCKENKSSLQSDLKDISQSVHAKPLIGAINSNSENLESFEAKEKAYKEVISLPAVKMVEYIELSQNNSQKLTENLCSVLPDKEKSLDYVPLINEQNHAEEVTISGKLKELTQETVILEVVQNLEKKDSSATHKKDLITNMATTDEKMDKSFISNKDCTEKIDQSLISNGDDNEKINESLMSNEEEAEKIDDSFISEDSKEKIDKILISNKDNIENGNHPLTSKDDNSEKMVESLISNEDNTSREVVKSDSKSLETCAENFVCNTSIGKASLTKSKTDETNSLNILSNISKPTPSTSLQTYTVTTTTTTNTTSDYQSRTASKNNLNELSHKITPISHVTPITHSKTISKADTPNKTVPLPVLMPNKAKSTIDASNKSTPQVSQPIRKKRLLLLKKIEADYVKRRLNMNSKISTLQGLVQEATDEERQRQAMSERTTALRQELKKLENNLEVSCRQVKQKMSRIKGLHTEVTIERRGIAELERKGQMLGQQELGSEYKLPKVLNSKNVKNINQQHLPKAMATKSSSPVINNVIPNQQKAVLLKTSSIDGKGAVLSKIQAIKKTEVKTSQNLTLITTQKSVPSEKTGNAISNEPIKVVQNVKVSCNGAASKIGEIYTSDNNNAKRISEEIRQKPFSVTKVDEAKNQSNEIEMRNMPVKGKDIPNKYSSNGVKLKTSKTLHDSNEECSKKTNEMDVMCPYDLMGRCNDDSCPYLHLKADKKKDTDTTAKNLEKMFPEKSGVMKSPISNIQKCLSTDTPSQEQHRISDEGSDAKDKQRNSEPNIEQKTTKFEYDINNKTCENVLNCAQSNNLEHLQTEEIIKPSCSVQESQPSPLLNQNKERLSVKCVKTNLSDSINIVGADKDSSKSPLKSKLIMEIDKGESEGYIKQDKNVGANMENVGIFFENKNCKDGNKFDSIDRNVEIVTKSSSNLVNEHSDILEPAMNSIEMEQEEESDKNVSLNDMNVTPETEFEINESPTLRVSGRKRRLQISDNTDITDTPRRGRSGSQGRGRGKGRGAMRGRSGSSNASNSSTRSPFKSCSLEKEASPLPAKMPKMPSKVSTKETKEAGRGRRGKTPQRKGKRKEQ